MKPGKILTVLGLLIGIGTHGAFAASMPERHAANSRQTAATAADSAPEHKTTAAADPDEQVRALLERLYYDTGGGNLRFKKSWSLKRLLKEWGPVVQYEHGRLSLDLSYRRLEGSLHLAGCTALVSLKCWSNNIHSIDVSDCPHLTEIDCNWGVLSELNISGCRSLRYVSCSDNRLTSLDLTSVPDLEVLRLQSNRLSSLDLSACRKLVTLRCENNPIGSLDLSPCPQLEEVNCSDCGLTLFAPSCLSSLRKLDFMQLHIQKTDKVILSALRCLHKSSRPGNRRQPPGPVKNNVPVRHIPGLSFTSPADRYVRPRLR